MTQNSINRLDYIDALRALAALLVVWMHVSEAFVSMPGVADRGTGLFELAHSVDFGRIGVITFFAISGFIIPQSIRGERGPGVRHFLVRRFFRLFPAYWLSIPLAFFVLWWLPGKDIAVDDVAFNFTMFEWLLGYQALMGHYWTLEVELYFYILCLLLFFFGLIHRIETAALSCIVLVGIFVVVTSGLTERWFQVSLPIPSKLAFIFYHLGIMFWGTCCKHCFLDQPARKEWLYLIITSIAVFFPIAWSLLHITPDNAENVFRFAGGHGLGLLLFIVCVTVCKIQVALLAWIGTISYSLYLFHPVIFYGLLQAIVYFDISYLQGMHLSVYVLISMLASIAFAWLVYKLVEEPAIALGRRWSRTSKAN